jgi:hypothetical protein
MSPHRPSSGSPRKYQDEAKEAGFAEVKGGGALRQGESHMLRLP